MREMIRAFKQNGHEVRPVIAGGLEPSPAASPTHLKGKKRRLKKAIPTGVWESFRDLQLIRTDRRLEKELSAAIEQFRPDVIYERASYLQLSGVRAAKRHGVRHVLEVNSPYVIERQLGRSTLPLLERWATAAEAEQLRLTQKVAVVSKALKDYFVEIHGVTDKKFVITPNAIDPGKLSSISLDEAAVRRRYGLDDRIVVGFVGSIASWHRVDLLIRACHCLRAEIPALSAMIVGDGLPMNELKQLALSLGIEDRVIFAGRVPHEEVFGYIKAMNIGVLPANMWYQSPVKVFEYGAMKIPVIAPDNTTMRELMDPERDGVLVQPDVESLTSAVKRLIESPHERQAMAEAFHDKVLREYTWSRNVERILDTIASEAGTRAPAIQAASA